MANRYSHLSMLSVEEQADIGYKLCVFFSPLASIEMREFLGLPIDSKTLNPLSLMDFFNFYKKTDIDYFPKMQRICELVDLLKNSSILQSVGGGGFTNERFWFNKELTNREKKGKLWLGRALGESFIGHEIEKDIAYIEGLTLEGDISVGSGILINANIVLTCAHVVNDMKVEFVIINSKKIKIKNCSSHNDVDIGLVYLEEPVQQRLPDLAFRSARMLEPLVIAGYPSVPRSLMPCFTLQTGQVCGHLKETMDKYPMDLFSAIARPGNSGGPVIGVDGCIIGIVTRSLERQQESADSMAVIPFFAAVPSAVILDCVKELTNGAVVVPWEDYS